jgi:trehalose 6-phosphate synthase/phosphatase
MTRRRLLNVSVRLPVSVRVQGDLVRLSRSAGGVATGLRSATAGWDMLWFGWPGESEETIGRHRGAVDRRLARDGLRAVHLDERLEHGFYGAMANGVLWPLLHSQTDRLPLEIRHWQEYEAANHAFADAVADAYRPGDLIWVHDYQLMCVPSLLRERHPDARIGFFLHVPFPPHDVFASIPQRATLLEGILGADVVGVHTHGYQRNLVQTVRRMLGLRSTFEAVQVGDRQVHLGVFPMGVDAAHFGALAAREDVRAAVTRARERGETSTVLGIDRLDYTKGIPRRLLAFQRLLEKQPEWRGRVRLLQVAVPSREKVSAYARYRDQLNQLVGQINGAFATSEWTPVQYLYRSLPQEELVALYASADVMLVTPVRDGMNLVAKEFVASRIDEDGVLVLSEFTGAADELAGAVMVNPYDIDATAAAIHHALTMPESARRARMRVLRSRVATATVHTWAQDVLAAIEEARPAGASRERQGDKGLPAAVRDRIVSAPRVTLLLDYDGTLVPFSETPDAASPDAPLLALLRRLAARERLTVHLVSGRTRATMDAWFGTLDVTLHAEHGLWSRRAPDGEWRSRLTAESAWREPVRAVLERFAARTPGALVEEKSVGFAWHWRRADPQFGRWQANELRAHLVELLAGMNAEVLEGHAVLEVRPQGIHKGLVAREAAAESPPGTVFVAFGDDRTDDDLFAALPADGIAVAVGARPRRASVRLSGWEQVRGVLEAIARA